MFAGLAIALATWLVPESPRSDGFLLVAFMLRDLALLIAGPLTIMIVNLVDNMIEQALAEDGVELPSVWTRIAAQGGRLLALVMMLIGPVAWCGGIGALASSHTMALGSSQQLLLYGGLAVLVAGAVSMIGGFLLLLRLARPEV